jgi:hypothetical protein
MPIESWFIPIVCRHRSHSGASWKIRPSVCTMKWAQVPGYSPRCFEFAANVFHAPCHVVPVV